MVCAGAVFAAEPVLRRIEPRGAQRGQAVTLNLVGSGLTDTTKILSEIPGALTKLTPKPGAMSEYGFPYLLEVSPDAAEVPSLARAEWEHIHRILADCEGNISEAARRLGIHRRSLQRKLRKRAPE